MMCEFLGKVSGLFGLELHRQDVDCLLSSVLSLAVSCSSRPSIFIILNGSYPTKDDSPFRLAVDLDDAQRTASGVTLSAASTSTLSGTRI